MSNNLPYHGKVHNMDSHTTEIEALEGKKLTRNQKRNQRQHQARALKNDAARLSKDSEHFTESATVDPKTNRIIEPAGLPVNNVGNSFFTGPIPFRPAPHGLLPLNNQPSGYSTNNQMFTNSNWGYMNAAQPSMPFFQPNLFWPFMGYRNDFESNSPKANDWNNPNDLSVFDGLSIGTQPTEVPLPPNDSRRSEIRPRSPIIPTVAPLPTIQYFQQARRAPKLAENPQRLLVVLDLNGTLLDRGKGSIHGVKRPHLEDFLKYCLANHSVMVWSSARPENVKKMCGDIFSKQELEQLVGIWGRDTLGLQKWEYHERVQVYKRLDTVWNNPNIIAKHPEASKGAKWDQTNTILIDDSVEKAASHPYNHLALPEFLKGKLQKEKGQRVLLDVRDFLEVVRKYKDVSNFIYKTPFSSTGRAWQSINSTVLPTSVNSTITPSPMHASQM